MRFLIRSSVSYGEVPKRGCSPWTDTSERTLRETSGLMTSVERLAMNACRVSVSVTCSAASPSRADGRERTSLDVVSYFSPGGARRVSREAGVELVVKVGVGGLETLVQLVQGVHALR